MQGLHDQLRAHCGQFVVQCLRVVIPGYRDRLLQQHRTGVESGIHLHDGDPGFTIVGENGSLDRRRAAPAWQQ